MKILLKNTKLFLNGVKTGSINRTPTKAYISIVTGLIIFLLSFNILFAAGNPGTTGANFLKIGVGPKAIGMGEAFSAVADDASTLYWNPAGLFQLKHQEISFMHLSWFEGINYQFAGYVHPTEHRGNFGAGIYYLSSDDITTYDNQGDKLPDKTRIYDLALGLSYAQNIRKIKGLDAGVTVKLIQENLSGESACIAADLGVLYRFKTANSRDELRTAFVIQNLGPEIKFTRDSHPLPLNLKIGISYELLSESLVLALDNNFPLDNEPFLNVGLGYRIDDFITLRAGYKFAQNKSEYDSDQGLRCGIGLGNEHIGIDYAFVPYGVLGDTHRLGLTYKFGKGYGIDLIETEIEKHVQKGRRYYQKKDLLSAYREFSNVLVLDTINEEAKEYLQKIKEHTDKIVIEKQMNSVRAYINEDKLLEAGELLEDILALYPEHPAAKDYLSLVEMKLDERSKQRIDAMYKQGLEFYKLKDYNEAISLWEKVLMLDPEYIEARKYIPLAQEELTRIEVAEKEKEKESLIKKSDKLYNKGLKLYKSGGLEKAKKVFEESIKFNPKHKDSMNYLTKIDTQLAEIYYNKGLKCYNEKNLNESVIYLQKAFYLNPQKEKIKELLDKVRSEFDEERRVKAEEYNKQALVEYTQGNPKKAIEYWEKALELNPEDTKIQNSLERAREELEKK
jgi:tetratricopeptide (TPR) repeat protein